MLKIIPNGVVHKLLFNNTNSINEYLNNSNTNLEFFKNNLTPLGIMISNYI